MIPCTVHTSLRYNQWDHLDGNHKYQSSLTKSNNYYIACIEEKSLPIGVWMYLNGLGCTAIFSVVSLYPMSSPNSRAFRPWKLIGLLELMYSLVFSGSIRFLNRLLNPCLPPSSQYVEQLSSTFSRETFEKKVY